MMSAKTKSGRPAPRSPDSPFLRWLAAGIGSGSIRIAGTGGGGQAVPTEGEADVTYVLGLGAAKRFVLGAAGRQPFIGCQDYDLVALTDIIWHQAEAVIRDRHGGAWLRLTSRPLTFRRNPHKAFVKRGVTVAIPVSRHLLQTLPGLADAPLIELRKIRVSAEGKLAGIAARPAATVFVDVHGRPVRNPAAQGPAQNGSARPQPARSLLSRP